MKCPECQTIVDRENINIQTDVAQCQNCHTVFKVSENLDEEDDKFDITQPPQGAWMHNEVTRIVIGATTRSPVAFFLIPFTLVWSGGSLGGIYGTQLASGEFNLFISLFGIPFLIGSIVLLSATLMTLAGKVEVSLTRYGGKVFTGVGVLGQTKEFTWDEISTVKEQTHTGKRGSQGKTILMEGQRRISFGFGITASRRYYLYRALKTIVAKKNRNFI